MFASAPAPRFDLYTMKVMAAVTMLNVSAATAFAWRSARRVAGMSRFTLGLTAISIGGAISLARVFVPGSLVIVAGNLLLIGGQITVVHGIRAFRGIRFWPPLATAAFCTSIALLFAYWLVIDNRFDHRVALFSLAFAVLSIDAARSLTVRVSRAERMVYWPTACAFAFIACFYLARCYAAFAGYYGPGLLTPVPVEMVTTICSPVAYILCAIGMVLASNTILRQDAETLALRDPLTNLPNRRLFMDRLLEAESRALADGLKFGIVYLDLDGFKQVNDILGHDAGDELLKRVSAALLRTLRSRDCLGRIGGDEFVALIVDVLDRREVLAVAEKMKLAVEAERIGDDPGTFARVSCGVAVFPDGGASAHQAMREADAEMYAAKQRKD